MKRVEVTFKSGDEVDLKAQLGHVAGAPSAFTERTELEWNSTFQAQARVVLSLDIADSKQLDKLIELVIGGKHEATIVTFDIDTAELKPRPKSEPAKVASPRKTGVPRPQETIKADMENMKEKAALRKQNEADKKAMLQKLEQEQKASREASRQARREAIDRQMSLEALADEAHAADAQTAMKGLTPATTPAHLAAKKPRKSPTKGA